MKTIDVLYTVLMVVGVLILAAGLFHLLTPKLPFVLLGSGLLGLGVVILFVNVIKRLQ